MKVKCAIFKAEIQSLPSYSDIDKVQPKGAKVIYGGGKRKRQNTPYLNKLHIIENSFKEFESYIAANDEEVFTRKEFFIFEDGANEILLRLRYAKEIISVFKIDDKKIDEMHHCQWSHEWIERQLKSLHADIIKCKFFEEKNIGDKSLHKKFPVHIKNIQQTIADYEKAKKRLIKKGIALFTCGW